ncbi:MAG: hypothetical protein MI717_10185 [Spirochaetales bacterium]|nr:hypothetical protein [Spirochaetales bacterium]
MGIYKPIFLLMLLFVSIPSLFAQLLEEETRPPTIEVESVRFMVEGGNTRPQALARWTDVKEGQRYASLEELQQAVDKDVQDLVNRRIFLDVRADVVPGEQPGDYQVTYHIEDGFTFIPVPLPLYDSNTGGVQILYVQIWDNALGTMADWFSLVNITVRKNSAGKVVAGPWLFAPRINNIRTGDFIFGVGFDQERVITKRYKDNTLSADYQYDRSAFLFSTEFQFPRNDDWSYTVEPGAEFRYSYKDYLGSGGFERIRFDGGIRHKLAFDNVDTLNNARTGIKAELSNTLRVIEADGQWRPAADIGASMAVYFSFGPQGWFTYYGRVKALTVFNDTYDNLGENLRGITDATMDGKYGLFFNNTLGIRVWKWKGVWDLQIHPFFDVGFVLDEQGWTGGWTPLRRSTGADVLLFIEKVPNLSFRFTWGVDLESTTPWGDDNKTEFIVRYAYSY